MNADKVVQIIATIQIITLAFAFLFSIAFIYYLGYKTGYDKGTEMFTDKDEK